MIDLKKILGSMRIPPLNIEKLKLNNKNVLLILDGLDEVPDKK
jgi:hypothetical protein